MIILALVVLVMLVPARALPAGTSSLRVLTALEVRVLAQINDIRLQYGLAPLELSQALTTAAIAHSQQMVTDGYFAHQTAAGLSFARRIAYYYPPPSSADYRAGENLFWTTANLGSGVVVARWMQSAEHRANLLSPSWREIGVAVVTVPSAPGVYDGRHVTVVTADFGARG